MSTAAETISFACPRCERVTSVPLSFAGKQGKCPGCRETIEVPDPNAPLAPAEPSVAEPPAEALAPATEVVLAAEVVRAEEAASAVPSALAHDAEHRPCVSCGAAIRRAAIKCRFCNHVEERPCRLCGEQIKATAKKCRFCGEFLDASVRASRRHASDDYRLASPSTRLAAYLIDEWVLAAPAIILLGGGFIAADQQNDMALAGVCFLSGAAWWLALAVIQWRRIATTGQTIAKRWFGIQIVQIDGSPAGFVHGVLLRNWIYGIVGSPLLSWIAALFRLVDGLLIFADDRRCLRDHIASTRVIEVTPSPADRAPHA